MILRGVFFDIDDTLCDDAGQLRRSITATAERVAGRETVGALAEVYERISTRYWTHEIALTAPEPLATIRERLWVRSLEAVGIAPAPDLVAEIVAWYGRMREEAPALHDGAVEMLTLLREAGLRLGLLTNGLSETHIAKVERLGLRDFFEVFLMPDTTGYAKPDPRQFRLACQRLGVAPSEAAHVGDSLSSDVGGAVAAGLRAVWFNPAGQPHPGEDAALPHHEVRALREVPGVLGMQGRGTGSR